MSTPLPRWCTLVRAGNPGPMTLEGTNTYVLRAPGASGAVVVDPGPLDERHLTAVAELGPVAIILLTHGHPDHAEGAARFREMTSAPMAAAERRLTVAADPLGDGQLFDGLGGLRLRVVATPGHTSDSVSFLVEGVEGVEGDAPALLTGDTILGRGTTVVAHPDGRLGDYLGSLARIRDLATHDPGRADAARADAGRADPGRADPGRADPGQADPGRADAGQADPGRADVGRPRPMLLLPGHGPVGPDAGAVAGDYLAHREQRLAQVRAARAGGAASARDVVRVVYADVDPVLWPAAELSVRAQLDYLDERSDGAANQPTS